MTNSPKNSYNKGLMDEYDYVDVEGSGNSFSEGSPSSKARRGRGRPRKKSANILEDGKFCRRLLK